MSFFYEQTYVNVLKKFLSSLTQEKNLNEKKQAEQFALSTQNEENKKLLKEFGAKKQIVGLFFAAILSTVFFWVYPLDFYAQDFFFCSGEKNLWCHGEKPLWDFLYHYGVWPAGGLAIGAVVFLILSNTSALFKNKKIYSLFFLLTIVLGPGLIINSVLKMQCGRPRPRETTHYQGTWQYHNVWQKGITGKGKSFPCGHCSMGFVFMGFYFIYYRDKKKLANLFLLLGIFYGGLIGLARMSQGGHFLSDVLWSGITVFFSAWLLYHYVLKIPQRELGLIQKENTLSKKKSFLLYGLLLVAVVMGIVLATPVFKENEYIAPANLHNKNFEFMLECDRCNVYIHAKEEPSLFYFRQTVQGFGFPGAKVYSWFFYSLSNATNYYKLQVLSLGLFTELVDTIHLDVHKKYLDVLSLQVKEGDIVFEGTFPQTQIYIKQGQGNLQADEKLLQKVKKLN